MNWLDKEGKVLGRIHWIDLILVFAGVFVITLSIVRFWPMMPSVYPTQLRIEILASDIPPRVVEGIQPGQWVKDAKTGGFLGKIVEKRVTPHMVLRWSGEQLQKVESPMSQDVRLILERPGEVREREGIYAGRQMVRAGVQGVFRTLYTEFHGQVQAVGVELSSAR